MTKLSRKLIDPNRFGRYVNNLWSAFTLMDSKSDVRLLFKDLFTHTEYKMFAKRLEIARRLLNRENYEQISQEMSVTSRTITAVNNILAIQGGGLRKAHEKLNRQEQKFIKQEQEYIKNLENPFRKRMQRKTLLGQALKVGVLKLDKAITTKLKERSAKKSLEV